MLKVWAQVLNFPSVLQKKSDGNIKIRVILQKDGTMRYTGS